MKKTPVIFSVGHSNLAIDKFIENLKKNDIQILADVRTYPASRFNPQFNKASLIDSLKSNKIQYIYLGKNMGGKGENIDFELNVGKLLSLADKYKIVVMCSEGKYQDCHRWSLIEPEVKKQGGKMLHISVKGELESTQDKLI